MRVLVLLLLALLPGLARADDAAGTFLRQAWQSTRMELDSAELARQRQMHDLAPLAETMLEDNAYLGQQLQDIAAQDGETLANELDAAAEAVLEGLRILPDAAFRTAWLQHELAAHRQALALFGDYAAKGQDEELRAFASETLPQIQAHLDAIVALQKSAS